jgi:hypothetical protein
VLAGMCVCWSVVLVRVWDACVRGAVCVCVVRGVWVACGACMVLGVVGVACGACLVRACVSRGAR